QSHEPKPTACTDTFCDWNDRSGDTGVDLWRFRDGMAAGCALDSRANAPRLCFRIDHAARRHRTPLYCNHDVVDPNSVSISRHLDAAEGSRSGGRAENRGGLARLRRDCSPYVRGMDLVRQALRDRSGFLAGVPYW